MIKYGAQSVNTKEHYIHFINTKKYTIKIINISTKYYLYSEILQRLRFPYITICACMHTYSVYKHQYSRTPLIKTSKLRAPAIYRAATAPSAIIALRYCAGARALYFELCTGYLIFSLSLLDPLDLHSLRRSLDFSRHLQMTLVFNESA